MSDGGNFQAAVGLTALLVIVGFYRYRLELLHFYFSNRSTLAGLLALVIVLLGRHVMKLYRVSSMHDDGVERYLRSSPGEDAVFAGFTPEGKRVDIKHAYRTMHTQVIGTTNAGKTESVIVPWAVDDIKKGRGLILIDGKSDRTLLDKLWSYAVRHGREDDFRILSICDASISSTFNPLHGGSALEVTERFFKSFEFENEFYRDVQYDALLFTLLIFDSAKTVATPLKVIDFLRSPLIVHELIGVCTDEQLVKWATAFIKLTREEREQRTVGLVTKIQAFTVGELAPIFNSETSDVDLEKALSNNLIIYCQLPVLKIPVLGKSVGKLVLQALQGAIASRHLSTEKDHNYFSVYLDDFTEYLTEGFVSTLNKSRSAKVLVTFAHQAIGDLAILGESIQNTILTNANLKVFMRTNEPSSAEYFASVIGTNQSQKITERQTSGFLGAAKTGEGSVREVEEFRFHPNIFKQELGTGEAVIVVPHPKGSTTARLQFRMLPDLNPSPIPRIVKALPKVVALAAAKKTG